LEAFQVGELKVNVAEVEDSVPEVKDSVPEVSMGKGKGKGKPKPKPKPKPSMVRKPTSRIQPVRTNPYFRLVYINPLKSMLSVIFIYSLGLSGDRRLNSL